MNYIKYRAIKKVNSGLYMCLPPFFKDGPISYYLGQQFTSDDLRERVSKLLDYIHYNNVGYNE